MKKLNYLVLVFALLISCTTVASASYSKKGMSKAHEGHDHTAHEGVADTRGGMAGFGKIESLRKAAGLLMDDHKELAADLMHIAEMLEKIHA